MHVGVKFLLQSLDERNCRSDNNVFLAYKLSLGTKFSKVCLHINLNQILQSIYK